MEVNKMDVLVGKAKDLTITGTVYEVLVQQALTQATLTVTGESITEVRTRLRRNGFDVVSIVQVLEE
jgi:nucleoside-triphosphatase THEP1